MQDFHKLKVWQKGHHLTLAIYRVTARFPREELFGLTSQMRRSSASIPANIAEGCGRETPADMGHFLQMAMGSASELEYHLLLSYELGFLLPKEYKQLSGEATEVKRMLTALIQRVRAANLPRRD